MARNCFQTRFAEKEGRRDRRQRNSAAANRRSFQRVRLAGQGMPHLNGSGRGDLFAEIAVQLPKNLSAREKDLFAELARVHGA